MVNYMVVKKDAEDTTTDNKDKYGICACTFSSGFIEVVKCYYDITDDISFLRSLVDKLNKYDADPIHLSDIIEDELYSKQQ